MSRFHGFIDYGVDYREGVFAVKTHTVIGIIYFWHVDNSDCNYPHYDGITLNDELATIVPKQDSRQRQFDLSKADIYDEEDMVAGEFSPRLESSLRRVLKEHDVDEIDFIGWWNTTEWSFVDAEVSVQLASDVD